MARPHKDKKIEYKSGRTHPQGGCPAVLEGRTLYTTAEGIARIRVVLSVSRIQTRTQQSVLACAAAGLLSYEVDLFAADGLPLVAVVQDDELREDPPKRLRVDGEVLKLPSATGQRKRVRIRPSAKENPGIWAEKGRRQRAAARERARLRQEALPSLRSEA